MKMKALFALSDPLAVQYGKYVAGLVQGDLGTDFSGRPVSEILERTVVRVGEVRAGRLLLVRGGRLHEDQHPPPPIRCGRRLRLPLR